MNRRQFVAALAASQAAPSLVRAAGVTDSLILCTSDEAERIRQALPKAAGRIKDRANQLLALADKELRNGPWSVSSTRPPGNLNPHDYYSEGPYFWPDPKNPKGPYIRKDGQRNPQRFVANRNDLGAMSSAVLALGVGAYLFNDARYSDHAARILYTWFVNPDTMMNPNLEHGQAVRGVNDGRGTGLIDTVSFIQCAQGILLLDRAGKLEPTLLAALRHWFALFLLWMTISQKGKAEMNSGNNHATWWTAQVAAYATLSGNPGALDLAWDQYKNYLVPAEIQPDGKCPREEARTNSLGYSVFNADAFATLCRIAQSAGVDLWSFKTEKGIAYEKVVRYVAPFVLHPEKWKGQQISEFKNDSTVFMGFAGLGLHDKELVASYMTLPRANSAQVAWSDMIISLS